MRETEQKRKEEMILFKLGFGHAELNKTLFTEGNVNFVFKKNRCNMLHYLASNILLKEGNWYFLNYISSSENKSWDII